MPNYNFSILSSYEFECLSRDLLQKELNVTLENFKEGRDEGIDLRYSKSTQNDIIVQAKRYVNYNELINTLKNKELAKVKKLKPSRYILSTSVSMTVKQKDNIVELFKPYIKNNCDVYSQESINNLLGKYPDIEKKYHKLWFCSTNILDTIVHKEVVNKASFELTTLENEIKMFVESDCINETFEILKKSHFVIISGIPGIGKTTLAKYMVYYYLSNGYDQYYVLDEMEDAYKVFQDGKKQIFFFDDFLGSVSLDVQNERKFENKLLRFIEAVKKTKDKLFIMTTREYILSDAKNALEKFAMENMDDAKCVVDIGKYTKYIRAKILYNHVLYSALPQEYKETLIRDQFFKKLVNHANFNPRVIEAFIDKGFWKKFKVDEFPGQFEKFFNNPLSVWEKAFFSFDCLTKYSLIILATMGKSPRLDDWYKAVVAFTEGTKQRYSLTVDEMSWKQMIKVLEQCFILTELEKESFVVNFFNPSILDFLLNYMINMSELNMMLIKNAIFPRQITSIYREANYASSGNTSFIKLEKDSYKILFEKVSEFVSKDVSSKMNVILDVRTFFSKFYSEYQNKILGLLSIDDFTCKENALSKRICLLSEYDSGNFSFDREAILNQMISELPESVADWCIIIDIASKYGNQDILENEDVVESINEVIYAELSDCYSDEEFDDLGTNIQRLSIHVSIGDWSEQIEDRKKEVQYDDWDGDDYRSYKDAEENDSSIQSMFESLLSD